MKRRNRKKDAHETTKTTLVFPCFLATPWEFQRTLRAFGRRGATQNGRRVQNAHIAEITSFAKHYVFRGLAAAKRSRVHLRPPRGHVFHRACSTETFFDPLFLRPFLCEFSPKRFYPVKIVVSALFRNAKPSHGFRTLMRSFAAPHAFICGPPEIGPWETRFWGASNELLGGPQMHPWSATPMLRSAEPRVFFVWGASNELLKWVENGQFGGPQMNPVAYIYICMDG